MSNCIEKKTNCLQYHVHVRVHDCKLDRSVDCDNNFEPILNEINSTFSTNSPGNFAVEQLPVNLRALTPELCFKRELRRQSLVLRLLLALLLALVRALD